MDLKINREVIPVTETILEEKQEQSVELDYVLPDYEPDIFRIISFEICPVIVSQSVGIDRVSYDLRCDIHVLYCSPENAVLHAITQQLHMSRSVDLPGQPQNPTVALLPKTTYVNCRAISPRRLEVRGAVSIQVMVTAERRQEVICDVFGMHVQQKKIPVEYVSQRRTAVKHLVLNEEMELGTSKPPIQTVIRHEIRLGSSECSILAGKLIAKGEATVRVLYAWELESGEYGIETCLFTIPYSQIVDIDQIDETYQGNVMVDVVRCDLSNSGKNSNARTLLCEVELRLQCTAIKTASISLVTDAFSTRHLCEQTTVPLQVDKAPVPICANFPCSLTVLPSDTVPEYIDDLRCQLRNLNIQLLSGSNRVRITGMLCSKILARDGEGTPMLLEKEEAFESTTDIGISADNAALRANVEPADCTYHLASDGAVSVQVTLQFLGQVCPFAHLVCLSELVVDSENQLMRDGDCALKLYYGVEDEDVWEIAKRCHTSVDAIMEENNLTAPQLTTPGLLFIPIVR